MGVIAKGLGFFLSCLLGLLVLAVLLGVCATLASSAGVL
jgi:uncharacterized membrane protein required for colicin V production